MGGKVCGVKGDGLFKRVDRFFRRIHLFQQDTEIIVRIQVGCGDGQHFLVLVFCLCQAPHFFHGKGEVEKDIGIFGSDGPCLPIGEFSPGKISLGKIENPQIVMGACQFGRGFANFLQVGIGSHCYLLCRQRYRGENEWESRPDRLPARAECYAMSCSCPRITAGFSSWAIPANAECPYRRQARQPGCCCQPAGKPHGCRPWLTGSGYGCR